MQVVLTSHFESDIRFYRKKKKYTKIDRDVNPVINELEQGNFVGNRLENLNLPQNTAVYKVRIANSSANVGKSHGFRLIYYAVIDEKVYLISIYSKKDDSRILSDK